MNKSILLVGSFGKGALEHQFTSRLTNLNWQVHCFDIQTPVQQTKNKNYINKFYFRLNPNLFYKSINIELIQACKKIRPNVIIVFKGMELLPDTVKEIKEYTKLLCNYNPDHPFDFYSRGAGNKNVRQGIKHYDLYGSYAKSISKKLTTDFGIETFTLPFGYDERIIPRLSTRNSSSFCFIGAYDRQREGYLSQLADMPLHIYGSSLWSYKLKFTKQANAKINPIALYNQEYADLCKSSMGVLNFLRPQNIFEQSHNMRTFEVPGYGGALITERTDEQQSFFEEDREALYFSSINELKDKLTYYAKNQTKITKIKQLALQRSQNSGYSYTHRIQELSKTIESYV